MRCGPSSSPTRCLPARIDVVGADPVLVEAPGAIPLTVMRPPPERTGRHRSRRCSISRSTRRRTRWRGASCCRSTVVSGRSSSSAAPCAGGWQRRRHRRAGGAAMGRRGRGRGSIPRRPVRPRRCTNGSRRPCASPRAAVDVLGAIRAERDGPVPNVSSLSQARRHGPHVPARLPRAGARPPGAAGRWPRHGGGATVQGALAAAVLQTSAPLLAGTEEATLCLATPTNLRPRSEPPLPDDEVMLAIGLLCTPYLVSSDAGTTLARRDQRADPAARSPGARVICSTASRGGDLRRDRRGDRVVRRLDRRRPRRMPP